MNIGKQIKKYRHQYQLSQEELAEKIFVSRQTISNWENDKNYPDLNSLVLLSTTFQMSLDELIKGDLESIPREVDSQNQKQFLNQSRIFSLLFLFLLLSPVPLVLLLQWKGMLIYLLLLAISFYYALKLEKMKKKQGIQTYQEILAFSNGQRLTSIQKAKEEGKSVYQKVFFGVGSALLVVLMALAMAFLGKYWL